MTLDEYIGRMQPERLIEESNKVMNEAISLSGLALSNEIHERITDRGEGVDGKLNGYSTASYSYPEEEYYVKSAYKKGKLKGGYKELREIQGMRTDAKILSYSGDMMNNKWGFEMVENEGRIGFSDGLTFGGKTAAFKARALEEQEGVRIFTGSVSEIEAYSNRIYTFTLEHSPLLLR